MLQIAEYIERAKKHSEAADKLLSLAENKNARLSSEEENSLIEDLRELGHDFDKTTGSFREN